MPGLSARAILWLAGAAVCSGYYWLRTQPFPRHTAVGVERRLFGIGEIAPSLQERPGGGPMLVAMSWEDPAPAATPPQKPGEWPQWLYQHARLRLGSGPRGARPALTPLPLEGAWMLEGNRLRYRWRLAGGWLDDRHLEAENLDERLGPTGNSLLDLTTGRTYYGQAAEARRTTIAEKDEGEEFLSYGMDPGPNPVSPALDEFDPQASGFSAVHFLEGREAALRWAGDGDYAADLIAVTSGEPYRARVLSSRSALLAASRAGRTLYLLKADGLWRLDLRKPVPELLREVTVPELPLESVGR